MSKSVFITGSTSGIGLGIAEVFAKNGYQIMFHGLEVNGAEIASNIGKKCLSPSKNHCQECLFFVHL